MRVLVCGGREYNNFEAMKGVLDTIDKIDLVVNGAAPGADTLSTRYARERGVPAALFPALWSEQGKAAGILRNIRMFTETEPDLVVAFPGGKGTEHMSNYAESKGTPVWKIQHEDEDPEDTERGTVD